MSKGEKMDRRDFFRKSGRALLLTSVPAVTGWLSLRKPVKKKLHECINQQMCGGCKKLKNCILPAAESLKKSLAGGKVK